MHNRKCAPLTTSLLAVLLGVVLARLHGQTEREQPIEIAALQNVRYCLEASCHLPTEVSGWFHLVLAQSLSSANPNSHSSIAFYPHLLKGLNLAGADKDAWPLVVCRAELRY